MTCRKARGWIHRHRDGEADPKGCLSDRERLELDRHLESCSACADFARELHAALALLQETLEAGPSESFDWKLKLRLSRAMREIHEYPLETPVRSWWWGVRFAVATGLAATLILVVGIRLVDLPPIGPGPPANTLLVEVPGDDERNETAVVQRGGTIRFPDRDGNPIKLDIDRIPGAWVVNSPHSSQPAWRYLRDIPRARSDSLDFFGLEGWQP